MERTADRTLTEIRRDLHAHAESGWKEFRTTALVAEELDDRGFELSLGPDALARDERLGVPPEDEVAAAIDRALEEGAPERYVDAMDGVTGLIAEKRYGDGPVAGVRVDLDALERTEARDDDHRPAREGFASRHPNEMHACGHDGHTAIGLGIARDLDANGGFEGTLRLFFQPAEEGGRGGRPMSEAGQLDDVDYFLALHLGLGVETGTVIAGYERPLSNAKVDATFRGEPAHAGAEPQAGRNAVQAAATAIENLYGVPRHGDGATRINVGMLGSPNPQNIIAEEAAMRVEVRGETAALNEYVRDRAERVLATAADMHGVDVETSLYGAATSFLADDAMVDRVAAAAGEVPAVETVIDRADFGGSEDASFLIRRVQEAGGIATYVGVGSDIPSGHHTARFDIDEDALDVGVAVVTETLRGLS